MRWVPLAFLLLTAQYAAGVPAVRQSKSCGTPQFATEVSAGCTTIKATEVDQDFNALIAVTNNLDHSNLAPNAGILGSQLDPNAGITSGQILNGTLTGADIAPATIARGNLGLGSVVGNVYFQSAPMIAGPPISTVETSVGSVTITTTNTIALLTCATNALVDQSPPAGGPAATTVTVNIYRDTSTLVAAVSYGLGGNAVITAYPLPCPTWWDTSIPTAGSHTYTWKMVTSDANTVVQLSAGGQIAAVSFP